MNAVLDEIFRTGCAETPEGESLQISSAISKEEGEFLQKLIYEEDPHTTLEIGLAYGISSLFICEAVRKTNDTRCIIIDPYQNQGNEWGGSWKGIGLNNLRKAGFDQWVEFYDQPAHLALPMLESAQRKVDFAFIDGWHTFDHTLVEFFFIDRLLRKGGLMVFDDADWPSVRKVCRYIVTNRSYSVFRCMEPAVEHRSRFKTAVLGQLLRSPHWSNRVKNNLSPEQIEADADLGLGGRCIALRKEGEDTRRWDFHRPF